MTRLQLELARLYLGGEEGAEGRTRVLVLELALPAGWSALAPAWQGVQSDLGLPPPAIAVSGEDGLQLWFSLAEPVARAAGAAFLEDLRGRYLAAVEPSRVRARVSVATMPPVATGPDRWSAFVAPDLVAVFEDTPWLDIVPSEDGQAALLQGLRTISPADFEVASARLAPPAQAEPAAVAPGSPSAPVDPADFLARVMNDERVPLALRIEAAKALLPGAGRR